MKSRCKRGHLRSRHDKTDTKGYRYCSKCLRDKNKIWRTENPEAFKVYKSRNTYYMATHRYGLSMVEYKALLKKSKGKCIICRINFSKIKINRRCHIDHDHKTGKVRGLLCHRCNNGLGNFRDSIKYMAKAIKYLKRNK